MSGCDDNHDMGFSGQIFESNLIKWNGVICQNKNPVSAVNDAEKVKLTLQPKVLMNVHKKSV